jgi:hypothetical protein
MAQSTDSQGKTSEMNPQDAFGATEQDILFRLGAAVLDTWDQIPRDRQQKLFESALGDPRPLDMAALRKRLAVVLHAHHERTGRAAMSQKDMPSPAGPHAAPHLTNEGATPGSGALPGVVSKQKDVDPGAG